MGLWMGVSELTRAERRTARFAVTKKHWSSTANTARDKTYLSQ